MKYCAKCGNANVDEAVFCSGCGSPLQEAPAAPQPAAPAPAPVQPAYSAPAQPAYSAPAQPAYSAPAQPAYSAPAYDAAAYAGPDIQQKNTSTLWLILNIISTVICCSGLFGILGIIFAGLGMSSFKKGDFEGMKKKSKISMILFIVSVVWGIIFEIIATVVIANWGSLFG